MSAPPERRDQPPVDLQSTPSDVLVVGGGPAALAIAAALALEQVRVTLLSASDPAQPWPNTYGIWGEEVDALGLSHLLEHRWSHTCSYFGAGAGGGSGPADAPTCHGRDYGLLDRTLLQRHWLDSCAAAGVLWERGLARELSCDAAPGGLSRVRCEDGRELRARLVVDASGHRAALIRRPDRGPVAAQAAYGVVGRFSAPPVQPGQFVLMDFRCDHLSPAERQEPPTFLYAMDLGEGRYFVEETSLALAPPVAYATLQARLARRLAHRGTALEAMEHEEFCLFPMNLPLPDPDQPLLAFGGAAAMVHPASGYLVGALLRRAPGLASALASALADPLATPAELAAAGWQALWPAQLRRRQAFYQFGLEKLMRLPEHQLRAFFATFFALPAEAWSGFLTNTLSLPELLGAMLRLFAAAPWSVRIALLSLQGREAALLGQVLSSGGSASRRR
ncbi:MAG: lycopene beta cyclase [Cyanobacteria bacterium J06638_7]